jgi:hypothetical protein
MIPNQHSRSSTENQPWEQRGGLGVQKECKEAWWRIICCLDVLQNWQKEGKKEIVTGDDCTSLQHA